jgi:hypothetical protein
MVKILLPHELEQKLIRALQEAGYREIGGILMGERIGPDSYRIKDVTIQNKGGTIASFVRLVGGILGPLKRFFQQTNNEFARFNYLGE